MPNVNGAQAMFQQLVMEGVTDIFSLPGAQIMEAFDVLHAMIDAYHNSMSLAYRFHLLTDHCCKT